MHENKNLKKENLSLKYFISRNVHCFLKFTITRVALKCLSKNELKQKQHTAHEICVAVINYEKIL